MSESRFMQQMSVTRDGRVDGRYHAALSDAWNCPLVPQGGIVTALTAHMMASELGVADQSLRSVTTVFAAQVPAGDVDIDVTVLRRGRSMSQASATARAPASGAGHTSVAVFGAPPDLLVRRGGIRTSSNLFFGPPDEAGG